MLKRLDSKEAKLYIPEIIETYMALDGASKKAVGAVVARKLKSSKVAGLSDTSENTLIEAAKRYRNERYEFSDPDPEYYQPFLPSDSQLFWPGDVVDMINTSGYRDFVGRPVQINSRQVIKDVSHNIYPQEKDDALKHYDTESHTSTKADNLQLVERGELWKFCHGEIAEFTDPKAAYDYAVRACDYQFVSKKD